MTALEQLSSFWLSQTSVFILWLVTEQHCHHAGGLTNIFFDDTNNDVIEAALAQFVLKLP